jgi:hypothetical protein
MSTPAITQQNIGASSTYQAAALPTVPGEQSVSSASPKAETSQATTEKVADLMGEAQEAEHTAPPRVWPHVLTQCLSSHVLSGLCKITGYEALTHGTNWHNYKSIIRNGANPKMGGETTKKACEFKPRIKSQKMGYVDGEWTVIKTEYCTDTTDGERAENHFYVFRDSELGVKEDGTREISRGMAFLCQKLFPLRHAFLAYEAQTGEEHVKKPGLLNIKRIANIAKTIFTPKIKFIYPLQEINGKSPSDRLLEKDDDYCAEAAYRTTYPLPADRIGLIGLGSHMDKKHVWEHIKSNPGRVALGCAQLTLGGILTAIPGVGFLT